MSIEKTGTKRLLRLFIPVFLFVVYAVLMSVLFGTACPSKLIFGFPCPACGMTRAHIYAFTLDFKSAFSMHPLFPLSLVVIFMLGLSAVKPSVAKSKGFTAAGIGIIIALVITYIVRMILLFPNVAPLDINESSLWHILKSKF